MAPTITNLKQDKELKTQIETAKMMKPILCPNMQLLNLLPWLTTFLFVNQSLASSVNFTMYDVQTSENINADTESLAIVKHDRTFNKSLIMVGHEYFLHNNI